MREGTVVRWHKQEGETVARGEVLADIETDKATVEFEAYTGGVLGKIVADAGVVVPVGELNRRHNCPRRIPAARSGRNRPGTRNRRRTAAGFRRRRRTTGPGGGRT